MNAAARLLCAFALTFMAFVACADYVVGTWKLVAYEDRTEGEPPKLPYCRR